MQSTMNTHPLIMLGFCLITLNAAGCAPIMSRFGYYKHAHAPRASPEEAESIHFPSSMDAGTRLTGPMLRALKVAMDEYRPPTIRLESLDTPEDRCLARWEHIRTTVQQANEGLFFVRFTPDVGECAPGVIVLDAGAVYAIDNQGRVLATE